MRDLDRCSNRLRDYKRQGARFNSGAAFVDKGLRPRIFGSEVVNLIRFAEGRGELSMSGKARRLEEIDCNGERGKGVTEFV